MWWMTTRNVALRRVRIPLHRQTQHRLLVRRYGAFTRRNSTQFGTVVRHAKRTPKQQQQPQYLQRQAFSIGGKRPPGPPSGTPPKQESSILSELPVGPIVLIIGAGAGIKYFFFSSDDTDDEPVVVEESTNAELIEQTST